MLSTDKGLGSVDSSPVFVRVSSGVGGRAGTFDCRSPIFTGSIGEPLLSVEGPEPVVLLLALV